MNSDDTEALDTIRRDAAEAAIALRRARFYYDAGNFELCEQALDRLEEFVDMILAAAS